MNIFFAQKNFLTTKRVFLSVLVFVVIAVVVTIGIRYAPYIFADDFTISTNTTWCDAGDVPSNIGNLTINTGVTLTLGGSTGNAVNGLNTGGTDPCSYEAGGWTLTTIDSINGALRINGTGKIIVASEISGASGAGIAISFASSTIDASATISANAQGYTGRTGGQGNGNGPGGGGFGSGGWGGGASYGGAGQGVGSVQDGITYGSSTTPTDLGSGGGAWSTDAGGNGGGAIRLNVTGTLTLNGTITANGANGSGFSGGAGSGGSIYVTTGTLAGSGTMSARGGNAVVSGASGGGGGGRIAVYYTTSSAAITLFTGSTAASGNNQEGNPLSSVGTSGFFQVTDLNNHLTDTTRSLTVYQNFVYAATSTLTFQNITVRDSGTLAVGGNSTFTLTGTLLVTENSTMTLESSNISSQVGGQWQGIGVVINAANIQVNSGSTISANAQGYTAVSLGIGNGPGGGGSGGSGGAGGGYGGAGGGANGGVSGGFTYGSSTVPTDLGSGGGSRSCCGGLGGNGGGAIRLSVTNNLTLNGTISSNGGNYVSAESGGGSGGSIYVTTGTLTGSGNFTANGGTGHGGGGGGGGGGRIAVYYQTNNSFNGFNITTANAGTGLGVGAVGTVAFFQVPTLVNPTNDPARSLFVYQQFIYPATTTTSIQNITITNGGNLILGGGSTLTLSGTLLITSNSTLTLQGSNNTTQVGGQWMGTGVTINAATVQVDSGSTISANAQGYTAVSLGIGNGPGGGSSGGSGAGGGGYGGGGGTGNGGPVGGGVYGSSIAPTDLGSGGGSRSCCGGLGGNGGGAIRLSISGTLILNGIITANGANYSTAESGGGSGGSIYVTTGTLTGGGSFTANGGNGNGGGGGGGGGGRIAVYYTTRVSDTTTRAANGGTGISGGSSGTTAFGAQPTLVALDPASGVTTGSGVFFGMTTDDGDDRVLTIRLQYVTRGDTNCGSETFTSGVTTLDSNSSTGWSGTGSYDTTTGAQNVYLIRTSLSNGNYCWRAAAKASTGGFTDYGTFSATRLFVVNPLSLGLGALFNTHNVSLTVNPFSGPPSAGGIVPVFTPQPTPTFESEPEEEITSEEPSLPQQLTFLRPLVLGSRGEDVYTLKRFLTESGFYTGPLTTFFGPQTKQAVGAFQCAQGIVCEESSAYGKVLQKTLAKLNDLLPQVLNLAIFKDHVTTTNVRNVAIEEQQNALRIEWENPPLPEFQTIKVVRSETFYPFSPNEGIVVFEGKATETIDTTATPGKKYYYSVFTVDTKGNIASGAIVSTPTPTTTPQFSMPPPVVLPPVTAVVSPTPASLEPLSTKPLIVQTRVKNREVVRVISPIFPIDSLSDTLVTLSFLGEDIKKPVTALTIQIDSSTYLFAPTQDRYSTTFMIPETSGSHEAIVSALYVDGTREEFTRTILVQPQGYVYTMSEGRESRIGNATVMLYWRNPETNTFERWPGIQFAQSNPVMTEKDGSYAFFATPGTYYLVAQKMGYQDTTTEPFTTESKIIARTIELIPSQEGVVDSLLRVFTITDTRTLLQLIWLIAVVVVSWLLVRR